LTVFRRRSHFHPRRRFALTKHFGGGATGAAQGSSFAAEQAAFLVWACAA